MRRHPQRPRAARLHGRFLAGAGLLLAAALAQPALAAAPMYRWQAVPEVHVEADALAYVGPPAADVLFRAEIDLRAEPGSELRRWRFWPELRRPQGDAATPQPGLDLQAQAVGATGFDAGDFASGWQPVEIVVPVAAISPFVTEACAAHAEQLRESGFSDEEIFAQDRTLGLQVLGRIELARGDGSALPADVTGAPATLQVVCEAAAAPDIAPGEHKPQTGSHADTTRPSRIDELQQAPDVLVQKAESDGRKGFRVTVYNYGPGPARGCSVSATATRGQRSLSHSARLEDEIRAGESRSVTLRSAGVIGALDGYQFDVTCRNEPDELKGNNPLVF